MKREHGNDYFAQVEALCIPRNAPCKISLPQSFFSCVSKKIVFCITYQHTLLICFTKHLFLHKIKNCKVNSECRNRIITEKVSMVRTIFILEQIEHNFRINKLSRKLCF